MISIDSNGLETNLIKEKIIEICNYLPKPIKLYISLSLDGNKEMYKKIRGVDGYNKVIKTFENIIELQQDFKNLKVVFQYTIVPDNINETTEFLSTFEHKEYIKVISFYHYNLVSFNQSFRKDTPEFRKKLPIVLYKLYNLFKYRFIKTFDVELLPMIFFLKYAAKYTKTNKLPVDCIAGKTVFFVDPFGNIYTCNYFKPVGNIKNFNLSIFDSKKWKYYTACALKRKCPGCWYQGYA